jgi:hypothetical protein
MYAGHHGGAYAKNSFGNTCVLLFYLNFSWVICVMTEAINSDYSYTAVGVFVLGRLFREAWGKKAPKMQTEFNDFLEVINSSSDYFVLCTFYSWYFSYDF